MLRLAAHLTQLFGEVPFPERFAVAAGAGFLGCEFCTPYEYAAAEVARWLERSRLVNVL